MSFCEGFLFVHMHIFTYYIYSCFLQVYGTFTLTMRIYCNHSCLHIFTDDIQPIRTFLILT